MARKLIVVHSGVYAVGHQQTSAPARAAAAVRACGPGAMLSLEFAAALRGMRRRWPERPKVTGTDDRGRPGVRVHRSSIPEPHVICHHLVSASPAGRTLVDVAPRVAEAQLTRAVNDARLAGYLHLDELAELMARPAT